MLQLMRPSGNSITMMVNISVSNRIRVRFRLMIRVKSIGVGEHIVHCRRGERRGTKEMSMLSSHLATLSRQ